MSHVLAVDGGNTKTIALVAALDGTILGMGRGGCGDIYNAPTGDEWPDTASVAVANISDAIEAALTGAGIQPDDLVASVFNMAGADWPEDFTLLKAAMRERGYGRSIRVQNDALGVLHAGVADNIGVSVVCGTGGATGARGPDGRIWHSSCWQDQVQGSSDMSRKAFEAVIRSELGIEPPTRLKQRFLEYYEADSIEEILHMFTARSKKVSKRIDGFTRYLLDEAEAGDFLARKVVVEHGQALGDYATVGARLVGIEGTPFSLVLAGGVLRHPSPLLSNTIIERVRRTSPDVRPTRVRYEPIIGVLFTALEDAGVTLNDALLQRMVPTMPPPELFATTLDVTNR